MIASRHVRVAMLAVSAALAAIAFVPASAQAAAEVKYPSNFSEFLKIQAMPVMHMMDTDKKGYVTKEEFMKFQEDLFNRMDKDHTGKVTVDEWIGHKTAKKAGKMGAEKMEGAEKK